MSNQFMFKEIAFTIYPVTDMKRSRAFYEGVLGLVSNGEFGEGENPAWVEYSVGPSTLALGCAPNEWKPSSDGACAALEVEDFDALMKKLKEAKVEFRLEPATYPTCSMAVIFDPDRNILLIHKKNKGKK